MESFDELEGVGAESHPSHGLYDELQVRSVICLEDIGGEDESTNVLQLCMVDD